MFELAFLQMQADLAALPYRLEQQKREQELKAKRKAEYATASHERRMEMLAEDQIEATKRLTEEIRKKDMSPKHTHEYHTTNIF